MSAQIREETPLLPVWAQALSTVVAASVLVTAFAQPAVAAIYHSYHNGPSAENQYHSWYDTHISGGWQSLNISTGDFHMYQETTSGYGGSYQTLGYSVTTAPGANIWGHSEYRSSATSRCYWYLPEYDAEGDLHQVCRAKRY